jgi:predicted phage tail protein
LGFLWSLDTPALQKIRGPDAMLYCFASGEAASATLRSAGFFKAGNHLDASMIFNCAQQVITPRDAAKFLVRRRGKTTRGAI